MQAQRYRDETSSHTAHTEQGGRNWTHSGEAEEGIRQEERLEAKQPERRQRDGGKLFSFRENEQNLPWAGALHSDQPPSCTGSLESCW